MSPPNASRGYQEQKQGPTTSRRTGLRAQRAGVYAGVTATSPLAPRAPINNPATGGRLAGSVAFHLRCTTPLSCPVKTNDLKKKNTQQKLPIKGENTKAIQTTREHTSHVRRCGRVHRQRSLFPPPPPSSTTNGEGTKRGDVGEGARTASQTTTNTLQSPLDYFHSRGFRKGSKPWVPPEGVGRESKGGRRIARLRGAGERAGGCLPVSRSKSARLVRASSSPSYPTF